MERENNDQIKEYSELNNIESWTEKGWTKVSRVIRHKLDKTKKLFRVTTHSGSVVVTDDHSLLTPEGKEISSKNLKVGDMLLHSFPEINNNSYQCGMEKTFTNEKDALTYYYNGTMLGYKYNISYNHPLIVISPRNENDNFDMNQITSIEEWNEPEEYVYDLTTENHHFHAGVGSMIVHNTDSIFSCYRFRENTVKVHQATALKVWKKVIGFAQVLIEPFFPDKERVIFNDIFNTYYSDEKIVALELPQAPVTMPEPTHHAVILPIEERIKQFVKEYMQESYIPWLWTLAELVEKNFTYMFDIKLTLWAEHQLNKIRLISENLTENRKTYLLKPVLDYMGSIFTNKYNTPSDEVIEKFAKKFIATNSDCFPFASEINIEEKKMMSLCTSLMERTIKEKWIYSGERKELMKTIKTYAATVTVNPPDNIDKLSYYLSDFIGVNKNLDIIKMVEILNKNLLSDTELGLEFIEDKLNAETRLFIETYNKNNGKKTMDEILEDFMTKELGINFDSYKENHYKKVTSFIENHMRYEDMSTMDKDMDKYKYYWIQPRWDMDEDNMIKHIVDIYEGGTGITDKRTLDYGMMMGKLSGETIKSHLPFPHDCEYEKTFWPFAILTKKRYVGNKYEDDNNKYKQDFMGIVLKRRDNAAIVKEICGGIIDYLINKRSPEGAKEYTRKCLQDMFDGKYDIKYFLQSRTLKLKESYKNWKSIAHVYLAEKISQRDPGNTPQSGDRIEFVVIKVPPNPNGEKLLQGDMIEIPSFIKKNNLEIDYLFYLTNQIMNPALQFLELVDKNAKNMFNQFIEKYSAPKIKKERVVKEKPVKEPKPKKEKVIKELKPKKEKIIKEKPKKEHEKNALDLLIEAKTNKLKPKKESLLLRIKKLEDEIRQSIEENKIELMSNDIFL